VTAAAELLLFQVGARVFGAAVQGAVRIGNVRDVPAERLVVETVLGPPFARDRGIVVSPGGGEERTLVVDQVLGFRSVGEDELQPLPAFATACVRSAALRGFVMMDDAPLLLVDLPTLVRERP
jgi:hypothetical protein